MPRLLPFMTVMVSAQLLLAISFNAAAVLAPVVAPLLGSTTAALGPYYGLLSVFSLLGGMLIDGLMRRVGATRTLQIAAGVCIAGLLLAATGVPVLAFLSAAVLGWSGGMFVPATIQMLSRATPPERAGILFAINQCGIPAGFGLAGVLLPGLLLVTDWRGAVLVIAAMTLIVAVLVQPFRAAIDTDRDPKATLGGKSLAEPMRLAWTEPRLRILGWLAFSFMTVQMGMLSFIVSYVKIELAQSHLVAGAALLASQAAAIVVRLALGALLDRIGRPLLILGTLGTGSGLAALLLASMSDCWPVAFVFAACIVAGGFMMGWNAVYFAAVAKNAPTGRTGTAVGGTQIFTSIGSIVGPMLFSVILSASGRYDIGFAVLSVFALVMGMRLLRIDSASRVAAR